MLQLRPYQEECVQAHFDWFARNGEGNPLMVVPTGGGKSLILAEFCRRSLRAWPDTRFLVLAHVQELVQQNHDEFVGHWGEPFAPAGIYSAGLRRRDTNDRVLFASIQSVWQRAELLGSFDLVLVDEAHMIPPRGAGRYRRYLAELAKLNPRVRVVGYTATHYRLDGGYLHRGDGMFAEVAYEVPLDLLVAEGHLVPLVAKLPEHVIDTSQARSGHGDFKLDDLEAAALAGNAVQAAVAETVTIAREQNRRHWLFFAATIAHAQAIVEQLRTHDVRAQAVFGNTPRAERDEIVEAFRSGRLPALVNVGVLTTGFNAPCCDLLAVMRPTESASLYVQMMGRGMRTAPGKRDCLVLDYGENIARHGPVNRVRPRSTGGEDGEELPPPTKVCPACRGIVLLNAALCEQCGHEFPPPQPVEHHAREASTLQPFDPNPPRERERLRVHWWLLSRHEKEGKPPSVRVSYLAGMRERVSEWVCFEHEGWPRAKAARWWTEHGGSFPVPVTVDEALQRAVEEIEQPDEIEIEPDGDYMRVRRHFYTQETEDDDRRRTAEDIPF